MADRGGIVCGRKATNGGYVFTRMICDLAKGRDLVACHRLIMGVSSLRLEPRLGGVFLCRGSASADERGLSGNGRKSQYRSTMPVYIDDAIWEWRGLKWAHLLADDTDELHRFAASLGIHQTSYQGPPKTSVPHYDLTGYERRRAIASGAIACSRDEIVVVVRRLRSR